ncbi:Pr6Pr family membrane protein [Nocardioides speluncae]|uniref:Pr6Pr family membrane protein n=1 Tax=Nocardioides speluncae TaxID=2670337 RepID=UPI000D6955FD|nr:Pr6Pr family membrane protein [Nocardioides speluncae]
MELRIHPLAVIGTFLWRGGIAASALTGWFLYGASVDSDDLMFLTQSGNLLAGIVYALVAAYGLVLGLATGKEPLTNLPRGAMTLLLMVVGCTYIGVIAGDTSEAKDLLTHVITPLLAFVDWCFVGRSQNRVRFWHPLPWLVVPSLYLVAYTANGEALYDFMDPDSSDYAGVLIGLVVATTIGAFGLYAIGKVKGAISRSIRGEQQPPPRQQQPYQQPYQQAHQQQWQQPQHNWQPPQQGWQQPPQQQPQPQQPPWQQPPRR